MSTSSNLSDIESYFDGVQDALNLEHAAGRGRRLGDEMANVVASGIRERSVGGQVDPDGSRWASLKASTKARKARKGQPDTIGVATGEMLEVVQLRGMVVIGPDMVEMEYGTDEEMKKRGAVFTAGDKARNREPREFYAMDEHIVDAVAELAEEAVDKAIG